MFRNGGVGGLLGEGFRAAEKDRGVFQGVEQGNVGLYGEEVVVDVVAGEKGVVFVVALVMV